MSWLWLLACTGQVPDTGELPTSGELRVLTYNVHGLPEAVTGDDTDGRMVRIAPLLGDFELIGLQEDFDDDNHALLVAEIEHALRLRFAERVDDDRFYGSGLTTLAPGRLLESEGVHYSDCNGITDSSSDCLASKGFLYALLELGAARIAVYNTHMDAGGGTEDNAARTTQVEELLAHMDEHAAGEAILLLGDTNLHDDDPQDLVLVQTLKDWGLQDSCDLVGCAEPGRIDRIMLRDGDAVSLEALSWEVPDGFVGDTGGPLSDHDPIAADIGWQVAL